MSTMTDAYVDLANSQLNDDLRSNLAGTFYERIRFFDVLRKAAQIRPWVNTPEVTDTLTTAVPGSMQPVITGDEMWTPTLSQITKKMKVEAAEFVGYLPIPYRLIRENSNVKYQLLKLVTEYPKQMMDGLNKTLNQWFLTATVPTAGTGGGVVASSADMARVVTLNGLWSSGAGVGTTNGVLDFAAPGSQTDTVFNLAKSNTYGHYNQYVAITSSADFEKKLAQLIRKCKDNNPSDKPPGFLFVDTTSYDNFAQQRRDRILFTDSSGVNGNMGTQYEFFTVDGVRMMNDPCMDITASIFSATDAANGFGYALTPEHWILFEHEKANVGPFEKVQMREFMVSRIAWCGQLFCRYLKAQGAFTGGAL